MVLLVLLLLEVFFCSETNHAVLLCLFQEFKEKQRKAEKKGFLVLLFCCSEKRCSSVQEGCSAVQSKQGFVSKKKHKGFVSEEVLFREDQVLFQKHKGFVSENQVLFQKRRKNRCSSSLFKKTRFCLFVSRMVCFQEEGQKKNNVVSC